MPDLNLNTLFCIIYTECPWKGHWSAFLLGGGDFKKWIISILNEIERDAPYREIPYREFLAELSAWPECPESVRINAAKNILQKAEDSLVYDAYKHYFQPWIDQ